MDALQLLLLRTVCLMVTCRMTVMTLTVRSDTFTHADLDDRQFSEDAAFDLPADRAVKCAMLCNGRLDCLTFTWAQGWCQGYSAVMTSDSAYSVVTGAKSFTATGSDKWCRQDGLQLMIFPYLNLTVPVWCDDGWLVIQRRQDGSVDFNQDWDTYVSGFGKPTGEFWIGLDIMHELTKDGPMDLVIDLGSWEGEFTYANYTNFTIASAADNYTMYTDYLDGTTNDSFAWHNGYQFTTHDRDNDIQVRHNCAQKYNGGWWFIKCGDSNLNGEYKATSDAPDKDGIRWKKWLGVRYSLKFTQMKVRP